MLTNDFAILIWTVNGDYYILCLPLVFCFTWDYFDQLSSRFCFLELFGTFLAESR